VKPEPFYANGFPSNLLWTAYADAGELFSFMNALFKIGDRLKTGGTLYGLREILEIQQQAANKEAQLVIGEITSLL